MRLVQILVTAILATVLIRTGFAQTQPSSDAKTQSNQEKKADKAKAKAEKKGKKTTNSQDATYAAAYKKGIPQGQTSPK